MNDQYETKVGIKKETEKNKTKKGEEGGRKIWITQGKRRSQGRGGRGKTPRIILSRIGIGDSK